MKKLTFLFLLIFLNISLFAQNDDVLSYAEIMPACQSCEPLLRSADHVYCNKKAFLEFMYDNIKYPKEAREKNVQGGLQVEFTIDKTGKVQNPKIGVSLGNGCDEEVLRVLQLMNNAPQMWWIAGEDNGKSVSVNMSQFIFFKIPPAGKEMRDIKEELLPKPTYVFFPNGKKGRTVTQNKEKEEVFSVVEEMPVFLGCETLENAKEKKKCTETSLLKYVYEQVQYPTLARESGIEGLVVIQFVVEKDGSVSDINVIKGIGSGCDMEVLRVIKTFNENDKKWQAGKQKNEVVPVRYTLPVRFKLTTSEEAVEKN